MHSSQFRWTETCRQTLHKCEAQISGSITSQLRTCIAWPAGGWQRKYERIQHVEPSLNQGRAPHDGVTSVRRSVCHDVRCTRPEAGHPCTVLRQCNHLGWGHVNHHCDLPLCPAVCTTTEHTIRCYLGMCIGQWMCTCRWIEWEDLCYITP